MKESNNYYWAILKYYKYISVLKGDKLVFANVIRQGFLTSLVTHNLNFCYTLNCGLIASQHVEFNSIKMQFMV